MNYVTSWHPTAASGRDGQARRASSTATDTRRRSFMIHCQRIFIKLLCLGSAFIATSIMLIVSYLYQRSVRSFRLVFFVAGNKMASCFYRRSTSFCTVQIDIFGGLDGRKGYARLAYIAARSRTDARIYRQVNPDLSCPTIRYRQSYRQTLTGLVLRSDFVNHPTPTGVVLRSDIVNHIGQP